MKICLLCLIIMISCAIQLSSQDDGDRDGSTYNKSESSISYPSPKRDESPDESAFIRASAGLGYYRLNPSPLESRISAFKDFNQLKYDIDPIFARQFEVTSTLLFVQGGLNYITNNFREKIGFSKNQDKETDTHKSTMMRRLDMFAGIHLAGFTVKSDFSIRSFKGTITSNGIEDGSGGYRPVLYYDYDGSRIRLPRDSKLEWNMTYQQYSIKIVSGGSRSALSGEMGGQYVRYKAPTIVSIDPNDELETYTPVLINSVIEQYNLVVGMHGRTFFTDNLYLDIFLPTTIGVSRVKNPWFEVKPGILTRSYAFTMDTSLRYVSDYARFDLGGFFQFVMISTYTSNDIVLKRDIALQNETGAEQTVSKGTRAEIMSLRDELFYGVYVKGSLYF